MKKIAIVIGIILIALYLSQVFASEKDKALLEEMIFPEAFEIRTHYDKELKITVIGYNAKLKYPSKKVLEFYDNRFNELGWKKYPSHLGKNDRNWMHFIDGITEGEPLVHSLGAYWHDKEKNKMATLVLRYHSFFSTKDEMLCAEEPNIDVLDVVVNISPFVDLSEITKKIEYKNK